MARRLLGTIRYFGTREDALPEWREAARIQDPEALWKAWPSLPVLEKKTLKDHFPAPEIPKRFGVRGRLDATGGSTGEPMQFFHDVAMVRSALSATCYTRLRMGWTPGMPTLILWGSERDIGKQTTWQNRLHGALRNEHMLDAYRIEQQLADRVSALVRRCRPVAIYGFTSILEFVTRTILKSGRSVPPGSVRTAWNGGEMLSPAQIELFRQVFGVPILNCYGGRELSVMACQYQDGGPLEVIRPWLFLEIVDEQGKPASPGETGRLLSTSTVCRGTPFLRYNIGDLGSYLAGHCDESGIGFIHELQGRVAGLLKLPDGRSINNIFWNHLFKEYPEIHQFQVILKTGGSLEILLRGKGLAPTAEQDLRTRLANFLGPIPVSLRWVERIPLTPQGKLLQVVREQPQD